MNPDPDHTGSYDLLESSNRFQPITSQVPDLKPIHERRFAIMLMLRSVITDAGRVTDSLISLLAIVACHAMSLAIAVTFTDTLVVKLKVISASLPDFDLLLFWLVNSSYATSMSPRRPGLLPGTSGRAQLRPPIICSDLCRQLASLTTLPTCNPNFHYNTIHKLQVIVDYNKHIYI